MTESPELRVQPQDLVAEQSVLGSIFISPDKLITVREFIGADDFYKFAHKVIFKAMMTLGDRNDAIDATTGRKHGLGKKQSPLHCFFRVSCSEVGTTFSVCHLLWFLCHFYPLEH